MDPLSIAASVAGLITLVGKVAEISRELYASVQKKPQLLKRLADELDTFQVVLVELRCLLANGQNADDQDALKRVSSSCEQTMRSLQHHLATLRDMFSKGPLKRLLSRSKFVEVMSEMATKSDDLAAYKLTLNIALQLRVLNQGPNVNFGFLGSQLRKELKELTTMCQRLGSLQPLHPIQQYIDISGTILGGGKDDAPHDQSSDPPTPPEETKDIENVQSFGSFEDWLNSFTANPLSQSAVGIGEQANASLTSGVGRPISRNSTVKVRVINPRRLAAPGETQSVAKVEMIELAMTDYFYTAIDALHQKGYTNVRGFRIGEQLLSPLTTLSKYVPVYVTDGPSSYSPDWLEMNMNEPFNEFHDNFVRSAHVSNALDVSLRNHQLHIRDKFLNTNINISLGRTLRLPEDGNEYNLPVPFGQFPLVNVDFLRKKLPKAIVQKSGVVIPMYQREALSINIGSARHQMYATYRAFERSRKPASEDFAIRVFSGGVNVISGLPVNKARSTNEQDYITSPAQKRLDGFLSASKSERSIVRQFVSMPTGEGYSAEGQVTGAELINGVQLIIAPPFAGRGQFWLDEHESRPLVKLTAQDESPLSMGFYPGTRLRLSGKEVEKRLKVKERNHTDEIWYTPGQSFDHYKSSDDSHDMRPLWTHEALLPILERREHPETLVMEPVFDMSITIEVNHVSTFPAAQTQQTWRLSPFITRERLCKIIKREFGFGDGWRMEVRYPTTSVASSIDPVMLHHVCSDGDVILVSARPPPPVIVTSGASGRPPKQTSPPPSTGRVSGWELGIACGGKLYQDVYADVDTTRWNWKKSQLLNIQILNAVAFETFTGFSPPEPPISFTSYLDADIPFYHIMPKSSLMGSEVISKLETVSLVDLRNGILKSAVLQGLKPIECILCDRMLADTILRPCNHVFCGGCIQQNMRFRYKTHCPACKEPSSHQIQFAGPMERPYECPSKASTRRNLQRSSQDTSWCRQAKMTQKNEEENEIFISSIRRSAMSAIIDDLERVMSPSAASNSSSFEKGKETIASSLSSILPWKLPDDDKTILQTASEQNRADIVEFLLQTNRQTPADELASLEIAAASGHLDIVKLLVKPTLIGQNKSVNNENADYIALKGGASSGMSGEREFWLQDEPPERESNITALDLAAENGHLDVVRLLLDAGLDPNTVSFNCRMGFVGPFPRTALARAAKGNHLTVARLLIPVTKTNFVEEAALCAAEYGSDDVLDLLIDKVGIDIKDGYGRSLIHVAAQSGCLSAGKTIDMLLKHGADANATWGQARFHDARLPVHLSITNGNLAVFEALLSADADIHSRLEDGRNCLHLAAFQGNINIGRRLLDAGLDPNQSADHEQFTTPLHAAFRGRNLEFCRLLLSRGAAVQDLNLLKVILDMTRYLGSSYDDKAFQCAITIFPHFQPLLCQVDLGKTPIDHSSTVTWAEKMGNFVVAVFRNSNGNTETALEVLAQVVALSPSSIDGRVVTDLLVLHAYKENAFMVVDSVMGLLPKDTCHAVVDELRWTLSHGNAQRSYVIEKYGSPQEANGKGKGNKGRHKKHRDS